MNILPDNSGVMVASLPLPKDHWLYTKHEFTDGRIEPTDQPTPILTRNEAELVKEAARYAVRRATMCGQEQGFDPDALVQNIVVTICGEAPLKSYDFVVGEGTVEAAPEDGPQDTQASPATGEEHFKEIATSEVNHILKNSTIDQLERDQLIALVTNWISTSAQYSRNEEFFRNLVVQIGEKLGDAAKLRDDGTLSDSVLALKVPEAVAKLQKDLQDHQYKTVNVLT